MLIVGCDFHPSWQQVSSLDTETGETGDRKRDCDDSSGQFLLRGVLASLRCLFAFPQANE